MRVKKSMAFSSHRSDDCATLQKKQERKSHCEITNPHSTLSDRLETTPLVFLIDLPVRLPYPSLLKKKLPLPGKATIEREHSPASIDLSTCAPVTLNLDLTPCQRLPYATSLSQ